MLNSKELAQKTRQELATMASTLRATVRDTRFKVATRQHTKVRTLREARRDLARVLTALHSSTHS